MTKEEKIQELERMFKNCPEILTPMKASRFAPIGKNGIYELIKKNELRAFNYRGSYLITQRHLEESDFVYGETLDMLVLSEAKDLTKLFHFMRKLEHVNDEIYILDAYGSLRNAEASDLECLIEDIQRTVNNNGAAFNKSDTEMG